MNDTAVLGLQVDSRPVAAAVTELNKLVPAAKGAEAATDSLGAKTERARDAFGRFLGSGIKPAVDGLGKLGPAAKEAEKPLDALAAAAARVAAMLPGMAKGTTSLVFDTSALSKTLTQTTADINLHDVAVKNGTKSTAAAGRQFQGLSFEARNLGYQLVDVTQGALMGQSAFQIFAQQGGQVAQVIAMSPQGLGGLMRELGRSVAGVITPMRLLGAGAVAAGIAGYAFYSSWKDSALALDNTARTIGVTVGQLRALQGAAEVKGIEDFAKDAERFSGFIYQARNNMGSLGDVLRVNGERATDFTGTLQAAARIINRATSDEQRLQLLRQMGLPATMQWVRFLSQGADEIARTVEYGNSLSKNEQELIDKARQFDEAWTKAWKGFKDSAREAVFDSLSWVDQLILKARGGIIGLTGNQFEVGKNVLGNSMKGVAGMSGSSMTQADANDFYGRFGSTFGGRNRINVSGGNAVDPQAVQRALSLEQQRLGLLGQTASVGQQVRAVEISIAQARLNGVNITAREADQLKELARQRALGIDTIRAQKDAYDIESATVGMSIERAAAYAAVQQRINEARRNGQVLTAANIAEIEREAAALGDAAARADNLRFAYDTFSGTLREFGANIRNGQNAWQAFGNAGANALGKIADRLMDMASRNLWNAAFGNNGSTGLLGGIFGGLFGSGSGTGSTGFSLTTTGGLYAKGAAFNAGTLSAFSNSVVNRPTVFPINDGPIRAFAKGAGVMGEAGPEAIMPLTRGPDGKLGVRAQGGAGGGVVINNTYTFTGVEPGMEARLKSYIDRGDRNSVSQAAQAVQKANATSGGKFLGAMR